MSNLVIEFNDYRTKMNEVILSKDNLAINVFGTLIPISMLKGRWIQKQKKCWDWWPVWYFDDRIKCHLGKSHELGITTRQMYEIFAVANIVGAPLL
ncbi:MAG: carboxymuconolactone decarboxylase family protein [Chitinophagaceae bacterium]